MKIIPSEEIYFETSLNREEVIDRIKSIIEIEKSGNFFFKKKYSKPYSGYIRDNNFEIKRNIEGINSFLPIIIGDIICNGNKSKIKIKMKLDEIVAGFSIFWLSTVSFFAIVGLIITVINIKNILFIFFPIIMLFIGYCIINFGFNSEMDKSKEYLKILLGAIEINISK
jgi:hypothetical protein